MRAAEAHAGEHDVGWEGGHDGSLDVQPVLDQHDYAVAWGDGGPEEVGHGWWDVRDVFGCADDVFEGFEAFFGYVGD